MPRIQDAFLDCIVYLYPTEKDADESEAAGGTGFLVSVPFETIPGFNFVHTYVVTNSHVIREGNCLALRVNTSDGGREIVMTEPDQWVHHPDGDDVAVTSLVQNINFRNVRHIPIGAFVTKELIAEYAIGIGDDVFMVGRFVNLEGRQKNLPSVRFGNIAMMPNEPIYHPDRGINQESFIVEMRSLGGYSGSPVMVHVLPFSSPRPNADPNVAASPQLGPFLLGIDWGHKHTKERVRDKTGEPIPEGWVVQSNSGMVMVVPAWKLIDILQSDELIAQRKVTEETVRKKIKDAGIPFADQNDESNSQ